MLDWESLGAEVRSRPPAVTWAENEMQVDPIDLLPADGTERCSTDGTSRAAGSPGSRWGS